MEATAKSESLESALQNIFGIDRRTAIKNDVCVAAPLGCGQPITGFRDEVSRKEFTISGMCQKCQDEIFGSGEEDGREQG